MASSNDGSVYSLLNGAYQCKKCGNNIDEFFFTTTNHSDDLSASPNYICYAECITCNTSSPVRQVSLCGGKPEQTTNAGVEQDLSHGVTVGEAAEDSTPQPIDDNIPVFPSRKKMSGGGNCTTDKLKAGVIVSPPASAQSPVNSLVDVTMVKSSFFSQTCSCGCSDRSDFLYIPDNDDGEILMRVCRQCDDMIGIDDTTPYDEVLRWMEDPEKIRVSLCDCGNENPDSFIFVLLGDDIALECGQCEKVMIVSDHAAGATGNASVNSNADPPHSECTCATRSTSTEMPECSGCACNGHPCGRTKIDPSSAWKLNPGDHLAWHRNLGYWHHAIVVRCSNICDATVKVIHYAEPNSKSKHKGEVVEEWIDLREHHNGLYRMEYHPQSVYSSDVVIKRGRLRLGEVQYSVTSNNCEHFARWCKTGVQKSEQVESMFATLKRVGHKSLVKVGEKAARYAIRETISKMPSAPSGVVVAKNTAREIVRKQTCCSIVAGTVACTIVMGIELYSLCRDLKKANAQHRDGDISNQVYAKIAVKRVCRTVGGVVGVTAGALIPIPVVGTIIGSTVGSLIGEGVGALVGRHTSKLVAEK